MYQENFHKSSLVKPDGRKLHLYSRTPISSNIRATNPKHDPILPKPEFRFHPLRQEWVIFASHRQGRTFLPPKDYSPLSVSKSDEFPTEMPEGDYEVAVFDNLFPSMSLAPESAEGMTAPARGACEVVVFTQDPDTSLGALGAERIELILKVFADRTRAMQAHPEIKYVLPFENRGVEQGVTIHHPHAQIYAYPFVPPVPARQQRAMVEHYEKHKNGLLEKVIREELADGRRVIAREEQAVAFVPSFARYPYETWIAPTRPAAYLHDLQPEELRALARTLETTLKKMDGMWSRPFPYLMTIYQAPLDGKAHPESHVHLQIYPPYRTKDRLKYLAGTELGAGVYVNDSLPEEKAAELRSVRIEAAPARPATGRAHGRVNLMGDHTDYNLGFVLPTPIAPYTEVRLTPVAGNEVRLTSSADPHTGAQRVVTYTLGQEARRKDPNEQWADYLAGCTFFLRERGFALGGFLAEVRSTIPEGSGLSSSAALEVSFLKALREAFSIPIEDLEIARLAQKVENEFVGARVGIMDQTICALGERGLALWIDTRTLSIEPVSLPADQLELIVVHSGVSHRNVGGGYPERRAQCEEAARQLGVAALRDVTMADLPRLERLETVLRQRARHVITENARVLETVAALRKRDFARVGQLFNQSHESLKQDFEVTIRETDLLVSLLQKADGVYGCRMTGGGFGGSVVAIAEPGFRESARLQSALGEYKRLTGEKPMLIPDA